MNAIIKREIEKKAKQAKGPTASSLPTPAPSIPSSVEDHSPPRKRKASTGPSSSGLLKGKKVLKTTEKTNDEGAARDAVSDCDFFDEYHDSATLVGQGPSDIAMHLMRNMPSVADASFMSSLGLSELMQRTCSSMMEALLLTGELSGRTIRIKDKSRKRAKDSKEVLASLESTIKKAKEAHDREVEELKAQATKRYQELETQFAERTRELKEEMEEAQTRAKTAEEALSRFKEEFQEACGAKASSYFEVGFEKTVELFKEQGYPPEGASSDFINLMNVAARLPPDT